MTLIESTIRLLLVVAALIWLPGWLAGRGSPRAPRLLHSVTIGTGIYLAVLVIAATVTPRIETVTTIVLLGTIGLGAMLAWRGGRLPMLGGEHPIGLPGPLTLLVSLCVALGALLRWFHNYHFDDFQHLVYLTEIEREGVAFPRSLMLHVDWASLPDRPLVVSRYPFWAVHVVVLSRVAGVPLGDAYYVVGLLTLAFVLAWATAMMRRAFSSDFGAAAGLAALVAGGHLLTADQILNYGGYPFQTGKVFVLIAGIACAAYCLSRWPGYLTGMAVALFAAPLMHTNNVLGVGLVVLGAGIAAAALRSRPLLLAVSAPIAALAVTALVALATDGFIRFASPAAEPTQAAITRGRGIDLLPANPVAAEQTEALAPEARSTPTPVRRVQGFNIVRQEDTYYGVPDAAPTAPAATAPSTGASPQGSSPEDVERQIAGQIRRQSGVDELAVGAPGNVRGRAWLFVRRSLPLELLLVFAVMAVQLGVAPAHRRRRLTAALGVTFLSVILVFSGIALVGQVGTTAFKPGYLTMRSTLIAASDLVDGPDVFMDPITQVFGDAAGWQLHDPPPFSLEAQFTRLLIFHPDVRDEALRYLLTRQRQTRMVINEAVLGPALATKFLDLDGVELVSRFGPSLPRAATLEASADALIASIYALNYLAIRDASLATGRLLWSTLFRRPLYVLSLPSEPASVSRPASFTETNGRPTTAAPPRLVVRPHLNSVVVRTGLPRGCFDQATFSLEGTATFGGQLLVHVLPEGRAAVHWTARAVVFSGTMTTARIPLLVPACGPGTVTFFVHGGHLYDLRFRVLDVEWMAAQPPGDARRP